MSALVNPARDKEEGYLVVLAEGNKIGNVSAEGEALAAEVRVNV